MTHPSLARIRADGLVPLVSTAESELLWRAATAVANVGLGVLEVALRSRGSLAAFAQLADRARLEGLPLQLGVGTVLDAETATAAIEAGAQFVFSPILNSAVGEVCRDADVAWYPGCATPTEIHAAHRLRCDGVKIFPADTLGGPAYVRTLRTVFPDIPLIPSGGVRPAPEDLGAWYSAGADAVGVGSRLFPGTGDDHDGWADVGGRAVRAVRAVVTAREAS